MKSHHLRDTNVDGNSDLIIYLWEQMLDADMNCRYFGLVATSHQRIDFWLKIFLAITASTTVSGWAIWKSPDWEWGWKTLSAISAIIAVSMPLMKNTEKIKTSSNLRGVWFSIFKEYELLWNERGSLSHSELQIRLEGLISEEKKTSDLDSSIRRSSRLVRRVQRDVCRSRGIASL